MTIDEARTWVVAHPNANVKDAIAAGCKSNMYYRAKRDVHGGKLPPRAPHAQQRAMDYSKDHPLATDRAIAISMGTAYYARKRLEGVARPSQAKKNGAPPPLAPAGPERLDDLARMLDSMGIRELTYKDGEIEATMRL